MSGIFGLLQLDGRPADAPELERVGRAMAHRGPDGQGQWVHGAVGLGHVVARNLPESRDELEPLHDEEHGLTVVLDGRLDDRAALARSLEVRGVGPGRGASDEALLLAAYVAWGPAFPARVLGDFAFALWDELRRRLVLGRDIFGVRPLHLYVDSRRIAFASEVRGLTTLETVPRRPNETRVADYLVPDLETWGFTSTFVEGVERVPPAHVVVIENGRVRKLRYWMPDPRRVFRFRREEEAVEAFQEAFTGAVRDRLRASGRVASMLSGGVDSGSVVGFARLVLQAEGGGLLSTYSILGDDEAACPETPGVRASIHRGGLDPTLLRPSGLRAFQGDFERLVLTTDDPFVLHVLDVIHTMYAAAARDGIRVMLSGVDGDLVAGRGTNALVNALMRGRPHRAWEAARGLAREGGGPAWALLWTTGARPLAGRFLPRAIRSRRRHPGARADPLEDALIHPDLARSGNVVARLREQRFDLWEGRPARTPAERHAAVLASPMLPVALERYDRAASLHGVEARHPLLDRRVVELCLALPETFKGREGRTKYVLRRGGRGRVPESVLWGRQEENLSPPVFCALAGASRDLATRVVGDHLEDLQGWVALRRVRQALGRVRGGTASTKDEACLWQVALLICWRGSLRGAR